MWVCCGGVAVLRQDVELRAVPAVPHGRTQGRTVAPQGLDRASKLGFDNQPPFVGNAVVVNVIVVSDNAAPLFDGRFLPYLVPHRPDDALARTQTAFNAVA